MKGSASRSASRPQRVQMEDVARLAGVSISTVSRALSGSSMIGEETRQRVVELARSLNYAVDHRASSLRTKDNRTIAVVVPYNPLSDRHHLSDPFYLSLIGGVANVLIDRGYQLLLARAGDSEASLREPFETGQAVGLILTGAERPHELCNRLAISGVPLVVWGAPVAQQVYSSIGSDNLKGTRMAVAHLIETGASRIGFLGDIAAPEGAARYEGYRAAHKAAALPVVASRQTGATSDTEGVQLAVARLLKQEPKLDALFASGDRIAMSAIRALQQLGMKVPGDVAVAGFDDIEMAAHFQPSLTTVRQPIEACAVAMADSLEDQLAGKRPNTLQLVTELIIRASAPKERRQPLRGKR